MITKTLEELIALAKQCGARVDRGFHAVSATFSGPQLQAFATALTAAQPVGPTVHIEKCDFNGKNKDGSDVFIHRIRPDGLMEIAAIRMVGWNCQGPEPSQPVQPTHNGMEIIGHQYQWTNPADGSEPDVYLPEWKDVQPGWNQTVQQKIDELLAYRYVGKPTYRVRAIYTSTNIAQPVQPEPTNSTALDASELLNQCESFLSLHDDVKRNIVSELDGAIKATS